MSKSALLYLVLMISATISIAAAARPLGDSDLVLERKVDRIFSRFSEGKRPGAAVLVMRDGQVLIKKGYGYAHIGNKQKVTAETNFRLASVSKTFTSTAILMLRDRGLLDLDQKITDFFPTFPDYGKSITVRQLLTHTSGFKEYFHVASGHIKRPLTDQDVVGLMMRQTGTGFKPGTNYKYCNSGYAVLASIVAKVSGKSYARFLREEILEKLGMKNSRVFEDGVLVPSRAFGYVSTGAGFSIEEIDRFSHVLGDGGIYTSIEDLVAWSRSLERGEILSRKSLAEAAKPGHLSSGAALNYGLGWRLDSYRGLGRAFHTGTSQGFRNIFVRIPSRRLTIVVLSNLRGNNPTELANRVQDAVFSEMKASH